MLIFMKKFIILEVVKTKILMSVPTTRPKPKLPNFADFPLHFLGKYGPLTPTMFQTIASQ